MHTVYHKSGRHRKRLSPPPLQAGNSREIRKERRFDAENHYRDVPDLLLGRLELLAEKDKTLMTMYLENGNSFRQLAQVAGVSEAAIARRIRTLSARLTNGEYITCLRNRDKFSAFELSIARDYFLTGLSMKKIAASRHRTRYSVCKTLKKIKGLLAGNVR